jgi:hypothetical protein
MRYYSRQFLRSRADDSDGRHIKSSLSPIAGTTQLLFSRQLWFILVVNPDGYVYNEHDIRSWTKVKNGTRDKHHDTEEEDDNEDKDNEDDTKVDIDFSGQRKNRRPSTCSSLKDSGVDLNRNYDICFARDATGSSMDVCAEVRSYIYIYT